MLNTKAFRIFPSSIEANVLALILLSVFQLNNSYKALCFYIINSMTVFNVKMPQRAGTDIVSLYKERFSHFCFLC